MRGMQPWKTGIMSNNKMLSKWAKMMMSHKKCFLLMNKKLTRWEEDNNCKLNKTSYMTHSKKMVPKIWKKWVIFNKFAVVEITLST
jgi:hypothetical protein